MKNIKLTLLTLLLLSVFTICARAENATITKNENVNTKRNFAIGLGYPYGAIKYSRQAIAVEAKGAFGSSIQLYAGRIYWNFINSQPVRLFTGIEGGYINLDGVYDLNGKGWEASAFLGIEAFVATNFSVSFDFAPTYIELESNSTMVNGLEYVINLAVYLYFY